MVPGGSKLIENFSKGDAILTRPEDDPDGEIRTSFIEEVFKRVATIVEIQVSGRTISTTDEHPFFVLGRGWKKAGQLEIDDRLVGHDTVVAVVEGVSVTDRVETVYNIRVAEDHTYFVGSPDWGFSVWVHNQYRIEMLSGGRYRLINDATGEWEDYDSLDKLYDGRDFASIDEFLDQLNNPTAPGLSSGLPPLVGPVVPYNVAMRTPTPGYDKHHLDPYGSDYENGPAVLVRNDRSAAGANIHTRKGGLQPSLREHITKDLGTTIKEFKALPDSVRRLHLRRYYASLGIPFSS